MNTLIVPQRFDLMAKYLYIKSKDKNMNTLFYNDLYHNHIKTFNNCWEYPGTKTTIKDFFDSFDTLIENITKKGYDKKYPIPIGTNNIIINGAHRLMICYYYNIKPVIIKNNILGCSNYNYKFFLNRKQFPNLKRIYSDRMALEYTKINPNIRCMILYPTANLKYYNTLKKIISEYGYLYYEKIVKLNKNGINNLVKEVYRNEKWIGGLFPPGWSPGGKARVCYANNITICILFHMNDLNKLIELKERCRKLYNIGKHSLHISDYMNDTFRISSSLLNDNSLHFLNNGTNDISQQTKILLAKYFEKIKVNKEDYCLTSSLILEMYGLRKAKDIDYLHKINNNINVINIDVHKGKWLEYYHTNKDNIIYNPTNHFYFNGYKFVTLNIIKQMKTKRNEPKDIKDIKLIKLIKDKVNYIIK